MKLTKNHFLAEDVRKKYGNVKAKGQLLLFDAEQYSRYMDLEIIQIPEGEEDVQVGDIARVKKGVGHKVDVEGKELVIFHKDEIIYFKHPNEA